MEATEKQIQNAILGYLNCTGHYCWRNNTGTFRGTYIKKNGQRSDWLVRAGMKGSSDILGIAVNGRFIAIECKRRGKKPTPIQSVFLVEVKRRGGYAGVAHSLEEAIEIMKQYE